MVKPPPAQAFVNPALAGIIPATSANGLGMIGLHSSITDNGLLGASLTVSGTATVYVPSAATVAVKVPVIASGGVGTLDHLVDGVRQGHASAVLAASIFHFGEHSVREAKEYMARAGLPMRLDP